MEPKIGMLSIVSEYRKNGRLFCLCVCDCGNTKEVRKDHLGIGKTVSCGCFGKARRLETITKHGMIHTRLYSIWLNMKQRCSNPKKPSYLYYGAKGVSVCPEWEISFLAFKEWADSNGYEKELTLDRIESNGNYCPENCRWITKSKNTILAHSGKKHIRRSLTYGKRS